MTRRFRGEDKNKRDMDELNDWIYVVFLIVAAVSGLFGSKGKKRQRPAEVLGEPEYTTEWDGHEVAKEVEVKPSAPVPSPKAKPEVRQQKKSAPRTAAAPPAAEEHSMLEDMDLRNAEELRKAVVYSEILNRKY